jgi:hypothetical protein
MQKKRGYPRRQDGLPNTAETLVAGASKLPFDLSDLQAELHKECV